MERLPVRISNSSKTASSSTAASAAAAEQQVLTNDPAAEALLALLDYSLAHPHQQQLGGPGGHPCLRLLLSRLQDGSAPGARGDKFKLGLVVEGGGMRGIVTGAMLMGLQDMGMLNVFDAVYGENHPQNSTGLNTAPSAQRDWHGLCCSQADKQLASQMPCCDLSPSTGRNNALQHALSLAWQLGSLVDDMCAVVLLPPGASAGAINSTYFLSGAATWQWQLAVPLQQPRHSAQGSTA